MFFFVNLFAYFELKGLLLKFNFAIKLENVNDDKN